jgi:hypothetical protein
MAQAKSVQPEEQPEKPAGLSKEELPRMMRVEHLRRFLEIGRVQAYKLANQDSFPAIQRKDGGAIRIRKEAFLDWLNEQE